MTEIVLLPMGAIEFQEFLEHSIPQYAAENVRAGYWVKEGALERSREEFLKLLPDGERTANHHLFVAKVKDTTVGYIWFKFDPSSANKTAFIYALEVSASERGKGYGRETMNAAEREALRLGAQAMALHVFTENPVAIHLYESLGFKTKSMNMLKEL